MPTSSPPAEAALPQSSYPSADASPQANLAPVEPPPQRHWNIRSASLQAEYVSGVGGHTLLASYLKTLPHYIDDTTRDLGEDLYERMMLDPQVSSAIRLLKLGALSNGISLSPAVDYDPDEWDDGSDPERLYADNQPRYREDGFRPDFEEDDDDADKEQLAQKRKERRRRAAIEAKLADDICRFCEEVLDNLDRPFLDVLGEMLDALAVGHKVAEQVYDMGEDRHGRTRLVLKALKVKPRRAIAFVTDAYSNVVGLTAYMPGKGYPVTVGTVIGDPESIPNLLPRSKFAILTWGSHNGDPRGSSLLRQVYNPWWLKMQTLADYQRYLAQFAAPSLIGYTQDGAMDIPQTDALGNVVPGAPLISPETAMMQALMGFKNSSIIALPFGTKVEPLNMGGDGTAFGTALTQCNGEISKGILCQTLATEEGVHMAKAASETHENVLDLVINHVKMCLAQMIKRDILYHLVRYNWGEQAAKRLTPKVVLSTTEKHNWSKDASALASLVQSQFLHPSQYDAMDVRLGLPRRRRDKEQAAGTPGGGAPGAPGAPGMPGMPGAPGGTPPAPGAAGGAGGAGAAGGAAGGGKGGGAASTLDPFGGAGQKPYGEFGGAGAGADFSDGRADCGCRCRRRKKRKAVAA